MEVLYDIKITGFSEANKNLTELNKKVEDQQSIIQGTKNQIKDYEDELKKLSKQGGDTAIREAELNESIQKSKASLQQSNEELKKVNAERREATKVVDTHNKVLQSATGSNEQLKAQLKLLTAEYNALSKQEREGTDRGRELQAQTLAITNELKANEKAIGDNRRNVGNYGEAIESALKATGLFGKEIKIAKNISDAYTKTTATLTDTIQRTAQVQQVNTTATNANTVATNANAVTTVKDTVAKVANKVATTALAVGTKIATTAQWLWNAAIMANPIGALVVAVTAIIASIAIFTKFLYDNKKANDEAMASTEKATKSLSEQTKQAKVNNEQIETNNKNKLAMAKASGASAEEIRKLSVKLAEEAIEVKRTNAQIANSTATRERYNLALLKQAGASDEVIEKQKELVDSAKKQLVQEQQLLEQALKDRKQLLINNAIEVKAEETKINEDKQAKLIEQGKKNAEIAEQAKQKELERLDQIKAINRTEQEALEFARNAKLEDLGLNKDINTLSTEELMARNKINDAFDEQIAKLTEIKVIEATKEQLLERSLVSMELKMLKELDAFTGTEKEKLEIFKEFEKQKNNERKKYLQEQIQLIQSDLEPIFADTGDAIGNALGLTPEDVAKKEALLVQLKNSLNELTPSPDEPKFVTIQEMMGLDDEGMANAMFALGTLQNAISNISNLMASVTERNKKLIQDQVKEGVKSQEQADKEIEKIEKQAFKRTKAFNIVTAGINVAQSILQAIAQFGPPPSPAGIAGIASASTIGALQIGAISAQKFATGGYVSGKGTATSDSIPAMLSNGEYVINAGAVQAYGSGLMDMINSFQFPKFATGGLVAPAPIPSQQSRIQEVGQSIQDQVVEVINVESSFTNTQNRVRNVERASTF